MNLRSINRATRRFQVETSPTVIRKVLSAAKGRPYAALVTADSIRAGALDQLIEALEAAR